MSYTATLNTQARHIGDEVSGTLTALKQGTSQSGNAYPYAEVVPDDGGFDIKLFTPELVLLDRFGAEPGCRVTLLVTGFRNGFPEFRIFDVEGTDQEE
jgi:hypothetical protein